MVSEPGTLTATGIPIDANVIHSVRTEISQQGQSTIGPLEELFWEVVNKIGLALNDQIIQEWRDACGEQWVNQILPELYINGKVVESPVQGDSVVRRQLILNCGLPSSSKDYRYVACAMRVSPHYVWSGDMDLYHPAHKLSSQSAKARARKQRRGLLCRYAAKTFGVTVGCYCHVQDDLGIGKSTISCPPCHDME